MENEKKDLLINKDDKLSESKKDKLTLDSTKSINVINFINSQVTKAAETNELKVQAIQAIVSRLSSENEDEKLTNLELLKLLEIVSKSDNEFSLGVLQSAKDIAELEVRKQQGDYGKKESDISSEDIQKVKKLFSIFDKLDKSEFGDNK